MNSFEKFNLEKVVYLEQYVVDTQDVNPLTEATQLITTLKKIEANLSLPTPHALHSPSISEVHVYRNLVQRIQSVQEQLMAAPEDRKVSCSYYDLARRVGPMMTMITKNQFRERERLLKRGVHIYGNCPPIEETRKVGEFYLCKHCRDRISCSKYEVLLDNYVAINLHRSLLSAAISSISCSCCWANLSALCTARLIGDPGFDWENKSATITEPTNGW